jgi:hypothetical protein
MTGDAYVFVTYWSAERNDSFIVLVGSVNEGNAKGAGYEKVWDECWVVAPQIWTTWPDSGPSMQIPFPKLVSVALNIISLALPALDLFFFLFSRLLFLSSCPW